MSKVLTTKSSIAEITWLDAASYPGRYVPSGDIGIIQRSVGYVIEDNKRGMVIGQITDPPEANNPTYRNCEEIPRSYIKRVRMLS